jgi:hypothetical protein
MSNINWDVTVSFDPNSLQSPAQHGIPIPSYGNYGGANFSAGVEGGTTPEGPNPIPAPVDALDTLFWQHDLVYQHVQDGLVPPLDIPNTIAQADVTLVEGMFALTPTITDPEEFLYDALATIGIASQILTTPTELAYLEAHPSDAAIVIAAAQTAIQNFDLALAENPGEARSLNAFQGFEARFAQQLTQTMASFGVPGAVESLNTGPQAADTSHHSLLAIPQHA